MEDPASPAPSSWSQRLFAPRNLASMAAGLVLGSALVGGIWWFYTKPRVEAAQKIYDATMDLWVLYDLQLASKRSTGAYVNGLDALLATTKDGPALKTRLAGHIDLNTAAIVGEAAKFKIELNVLDKDRTLVKIKGPIDELIWPYGKTAVP